jgi:hypothetical protein
MDIFDGNMHKFIYKFRFGRDFLIFMELWGHITQFAIFSYKNVCGLYFRTCVQYV